MRVGFILDQVLDTTDEILKEPKTCCVEEKTRGFVRTWKLLTEWPAEPMMLKVKTVGRRFVLDKIECLILVESEVINAGISDWFSEALEYWS
jgi:hypothetical protein